MKSVQKSRKTSKGVSRETDILLKIVAHRQWLKQVEGILGFLQRLKSVEGMRDEGWVKGTKNYYLTRLIKLLDNAPKGVERIVSEVRDKMTTLL